MTDMTTLVPIYCKPWRTIVFVPPKTKEALLAKPWPYAVEWQRIETAPKDGTEIEIKYLSDDPRRVRWGQSRSGTYWHLCDAFTGTIIEFEPTHWRPVS